MGDHESGSAEKTRAPGRRPSMSRRDMVSALGVGAAGTIFGLARGGEAAELAEAMPAMALPPAGASTDAYLDWEERFFGRLARMFLVDQHPAYLAVGQKGSVPKPVLRRYHEGLEQIARDPFPVYLEPSATTRARIAGSYGARVDEIAISRNATDAISQILSGIDWAPGDEILASTMEYPNCVATMLRVAGRWSLPIRQFGIPMPPDATAGDVVDSIRRQIRPGRTKVLFFSCPIQPIGMRTPARRIAALAQEHGITTVVDGAHYGGQFPPRLDEMGIDFWGISGHKWQCGPGGTGILYARNATSHFNPNPLPRFHLIRSGDLTAPVDGSRPESFDIGAALSLYGFPESADWRALGEVCELWDLIGRERIRDYILALADYARQRITRAFGQQALLLQSRDPDLRCGIVAFNPFPETAQRRDGALGDRFCQRLFDEYGYRVGHAGLGPSGLTRPPDPEAQAFPAGCIPNRDPITNVPAPTDYPVRINAFIWNERRQYDDFVSACEHLVRRMI